MVAFSDFTLEPLSEDWRRRLNERRRTSAIDDCHSAILEQISHGTPRVKAKVRSVPQPRPCVSLPPQHSREPIVPNGIVWDRDDPERISQDANGEQVSKKSDGIGHVL